MLISLALEFKKLKGVFPYNLSAPKASAKGILWASCFDWLPPNSWSLHFPSFSYLHPHSSSSFSCCIFSSSHSLTKWNKHLDFCENILHQSALNILHHWNFGIFPLFGGHGISTISYRVFLSFNSKSHLGPILMIRSNCSTLACLDAWTSSQGNQLGENLSATLQL